MNLRPRFLLLTALFFIVIAAPSWMVVRAMAESIVEQWAVRFAEKQVLYDKSRTLQPLLRELALSRQLATSPVIRRWAKDVDNPLLYQQALAELESYRLSFQDQNYFVALLKSGRYYHNNAHNDYLGKELRYVLNPRAAKDAWFYDLIRHNRDVNIHVNPDLDLGITKLWIDILIRDGNEILGIIGTGLDVSKFIDTVVEEHIPGATSLFVDHEGAIQIHRNQQLIDMGTISKTAAQKNTIRLLFDRDEDLLAVQKAMMSLVDQKSAVSTLFATLKGKRHLVGVAYLPEIDWYEITLLDLDVLLPVSQFSGLLVVYGLTLGGLLLLFNLALRRHVILPLERLNQAMSQIEAGENPEPTLKNLGSGEIRQLMQRFVQMANTVTESRHDLETKVQERTAALDRLTKTDPLTELLNRRGMQERLEEELARASRESWQLGILWLDVDKFKEINDQYGHAVGDEAIRTIARLIEKPLRPYDAVARWGGDEFLVVLANMTQDSLDRLGERLRAEIASCDTVRTPNGEIVPLTVSIGGHLQVAEDTIDSLLHRGDLALFAAKGQQRNAYQSSLGCNADNAQA